MKNTQLAAAICLIALNLSACGSSDNNPTADPEPPEAGSPNSDVSNPSNNNGSVSGNLSGTWSTGCVLFVDDITSPEVDSSDIARYLNTTITFTGNELSSHHEMYLEEECVTAVFENDRQGTYSEQADQVTTNSGVSATVITVHETHVDGLTYEAYIDKELEERYQNMDAVPSEWVDQWKAEDRAEMEDEQISTSIYAVIDGVLYIGTDALDENGDWDDDAIPTTLDFDVPYYKQ